MRYQPVRMVCGVVFMAAVIGLLSLIDNAAANALFSLAVAGNDLAWLTPILTRLVWGQDRFVPGEFYTGKYLSRPIAWISVVYLSFVIVLSMIPTEGPNPTREYSLFDMDLEVLILNLLLTCLSCSSGYELHCCDQRVFVAGGYIVLCSAC